MMETAKKLTLLEAKGYVQDRDGEKEIAQSTVQRSELIRETASQRRGR